LEELKTGNRYSIVRGLLCGTIDPEEVMKAHDIYCQEIKMHGAVMAFVYHSSQGKYYITVNKSLSPESKEIVFFHELRHIIEDMPSLGYVVGLDMLRNPIEKRADLFFKEISATFEVGF
jgi:Zn-dependent peptidase ImmA (M78 family)